MRRKSRVITIVTIAVVVLVGGFLAIGPAVVERSRNVVVPHAPWPASDAAKALHATLVIGDWHTDSLLWNRDLLQRSSRGHVDFPRLDEGNVGVQVLTAVTKSPSGHNYERNATDARDNITSLAIAPRHDRASELDSWDCVDELVAEEDYSQEWGEAASR